MDMPTVPKATVPKPAANDGWAKGFTKTILDNAGSPSLAVPSAVRPGAERSIDLSARGVASNDGDAPSTGSISSAAVPVLGDALRGPTL